ncbi:MAG: hypothetical protein LBE30_01990 [Comamonas sp.]|nr:hypothetical protein [Comamonas sp.]
MRAVWGLLSLVVVLAVVGVLVQKSWRSSRESLTRQTSSQPAGHNRASESGNVRDQSQQIQQQYRQQLESAINAPRSMPDAQ